METTSTLEINNFRGIKSLTIKDLGTVNIFVGDNGVGKTTALESVSFALGIRPKMFQYLAGKRDLKNPSQIISTLFNSTQIDHYPKIELTTKKGVHKVEIRPLDYSRAQELINRTPPHSNDNNVEDYVSPSSKLHGISVHYSFDAEELQKSEHALHIDHFHSQETQVSKDGGGIFYISSRQANSINETARMLSRIQSNVETEESLYESLRCLVPDLRRLRTVFGGENTVSVFADFEDRKSVPINVLGDGFCRLILILTGLYSENSKNLIIDDIDSGIHAENMSQIWQTLVKIAVKEDIQIFCVTHNEEMLQASLEGFLEDQEDLRVFRLSKKDGLHHAQKYDYQLFESSLKMGTPIK